MFNDIVCMTYLFVNTISIFFSESVMGDAYILLSSISLAPSLRFWYDVLRYTGYVRNWGNEP